MLGQSIGLSEDEINAMEDPEACDKYDATDRLVLAYASALTRDNFIDDEMFAQLSESFDKTELMELAGTVSFANFVNRMHSTFRTPLDGATKELVGDAEACALRQGKINRTD